VSIWRNASKQCHDNTTGILSEKKSTKQALSAEHCKVHLPSGSCFLYFSVPSCLSASLLTVCMIICFEQLSVHLPD